MDNQASPREQDTTSGSVQWQANDRGCKRFHGTQCANATGHADTDADSSGNGSALGSRIVVSGAMPHNGDSTLRDSDITNLPANVQERECDGREHKRARIDRGSCTTEQSCASVMPAMAKADTSNGAKEQMCPALHLDADACVPSGGSRIASWPLGESDDEEYGQLDRNANEDDDKDKSARAGYGVMLCLARVPAPDANPSAMALAAKALIYNEAYTVGELHMSREAFESVVPLARRLVVVQSAAPCGRVALDLEDAYRWLKCNPDGALFGPFGACQLAPHQRRWLLAHAERRLPVDRHVETSDAYEPEWWDTLDGAGGAASALLLPYHEPPSGDALDAAIDANDVDVVLHTLTVASDRDELVGDAMRSRPRDTLCRAAVNGHCAVFRQLVGHPAVCAELTPGDMCLLVCTFIASGVSPDIVRIAIDTLAKCVAAEEAGLRTAAVSNNPTPQANDAAVREEDYSAEQEDRSAGQQTVGVVEESALGENFMLTPDHVRHMYGLCCERAPRGDHAIATELWRHFGVRPDGACLVRAVHMAADEVFYALAAMIDTRAESASISADAVGDICDACVRADRPDLLRFALRWGGHLIDAERIARIEALHVAQLARPAHFQAASVLAYWRRRRERAATQQHDTAPQAHTAHVLPTGKGAQSRRHTHALGCAEGESLPRWDVFDPPARVLSTAPTNSGVSDERTPSAIAVAQIEALLCAAGVRVRRGERDSRTPRADDDGDDDGSAARSEDDDDGEGTNSDGSYIYTGSPSGSSNGSPTESDADDSPNASPTDGDVVTANTNSSEEMVAAGIESFTVEPSPPDDISSSQVTDADGRHRRRKEAEQRCRYYHDVDVMERLVRPLARDLDPRNREEREEPAEEEKKSVAGDDTARNQGRIKSDNSDHTFLNFLWRISDDGTPADSDDDDNGDDDDDNDTLD